MILVDTSIWIDHLRRAEPVLADYLAADAVGIHPAVIEELALGSLKRRGETLSLLADLREFPVLSHAELLYFVEQEALWGRGLSAVDAGLLGAVRVVPGARLWTRDKRLRSVAADLAVPVVEA